jgi:hypothetical protein
MPPHLAPDLPTRPEHFQMLNEIAQLSSDDCLATRQSRKFFLRPSDLANLLRRMPPDFKLSYPSEFNFMTRLGMRGMDQSDRLNIILHSAPMLWLKDNNPVECSRTIRQIVPKMPARLQHEVVTYILSGTFAPSLASANPHEYGRLLLDLVISPMEPDAATAFARVSCIDPDLELYSVIPTKKFGLPPLAMMKPEPGKVKIGAIHHNFLSTLPDVAKIALYNAFSEASNAAAQKGDFGTSAQLVSAIDVLQQYSRPSPLT